MVEPIATSHLPISRLETKSITRHGNSHCAISRKEISCKATGCAPDTRALSHASAHGSQATRRGLKALRTAPRNQQYSLPA